jgi:endonuclease/exonuclease/phosphatase family metal-dependent hydrolase
MASPLYLANVHLEASAEKGATRLAQLRKLLRRIELQCATDVANGNGRSRDLSPEADAHDAAVVIAGDFNFDRTSELHSFLSTGSFPAMEQGRTKGTTEYALLPLNDAYLETPPPWGPTVRSTYRNGRLLDFVWSSSAVEILRTMPASKLAGSTRPHQLPSATHPSDHLPIGAVFSWPGEPAHDVSGLRPAWQQLSIESVVKRRGTPKQ